MNRRLTRVFGLLMVVSGAALILAACVGRGSGQAKPGLVVALIGGGLLVLWGTMGED